MRIGILSDSHDNLRRLKSALAIFARNGVRTIVHCGDIGSTQSVRILSSAEGIAYLVAGNTDRHIDRLEIAASECNVRFAWEVVTVPIGGDRLLAATHGHDEGILGELILGQQFPYVCHGHTHHLRDDRIGVARVINPGALHRTPHPSVAILDTDTDKLEIIAVPDQAQPAGSIVTPGTATL